MKIARMVFMVLGIALLMFVVAPVASAQFLPTPPNTPGFAVWNGTLLKLTMQTKGYYYEPTTRNNLNAYDAKISDNETRYGIVTGDIDGNFQIDIYSKGDNKVCVPEMTLPLYYVAGSQVEFVAGFLIEPIIDGEAAAAVDGILSTYASGVLYVKAKLDNEGKIKKGGTISTVAAFAIEQGFDVALDLAVSGLTIKGSVVKELGCTLPTI